MRIGIVGTGFVSEYYMAQRHRHRSLQFVAAYDRDAARRKAFCERHRVKEAPTLEVLLADGFVDTIVNLTDPESHFDVTAAALRAGKHVYSEKPLALTTEKAAELGRLATAKGLTLSAAPCLLHGKAMTTLRETIHAGRIGRVLAVYAQLDDGLIHTMPTDKWRNAAGVPWPAKGEFALGCVLEHAAYHVSWLVHCFGPVREVSAFSRTLVPHKVPEGRSGVDYSVASLAWESGVVARLTTTWIAPRDRSICVVGEEGILRLTDCWRWNAPVKLYRARTLRRRTFFLPWGRRLSGDFSLFGRPRPSMDFLEGVAQLANAVREKKKPVLDAQFSLHVNDVVLAIERGGDSVLSAPQAQLAGL